MDVVGIAAIWFYHRIPADFVMTELTLAMMMMMVIVVVRVVVEIVIRSEILGLRKD